MEIFLLFSQRIGSFFDKDFFQFILWLYLLADRRYFRCFHRTVTPYVFDNHAIVFTKWSLDLFSIDFVSVRWLIVVFRRTSFLTAEAYTYHNWPLMPFTRRYYLSVLFNWHNIEQWPSHWAMDDRNDPYARCQVYFEKNSKTCTRPALNRNKTTKRI